MKLVLSHPTGNANVRAASMGFLEADLLSEFHTTIACFEGSLLDKLASFRAFSEIRRRRFDLRLKSKTLTSPWLEVGRLIALKGGLTSVSAKDSPFCIDSVYRDLDNRISNKLQRKANRKVLNAVYAYEDGALSSFRAATRLGLQCYYDLPIGYWRAGSRLLEREKERWPDWIPTLNGFKDSEEKLKRKDEELRLADRIFVASQFTANTLQEFPGPLAPIEVIPYGFPEPGQPRQYKTNKEKPLKVLFVGGLSQRKGIADLFAAVKAFGQHVQLTVVGKKVTDDCPALKSALGDHCWIPSLPHNRILELMREHDVLVFPSLFEGFGLVITEAMSQGTPVITTDRTAGPDLIKHDENGWLIEAGSTEALKSAVEKLIIHRDLVAEIGMNAMETARMRSWASYGSELAAAVLNAQN